MAIVILTIILKYWSVVFIHAMLWLLKKSAIFLEAIRANKKTTIYLEEK
jgi:hypothetical protein